MMDYKRMAEIVSKEVDLKLEKKRKRTILVKRISFSVSGICAAIVVCAGIWHNDAVKNAFRNKNPDTIISETDTTTSPSYTTKIPITTAAFNETAVNSVTTNTESQISSPIVTDTQITVTDISDNITDLTSVNTDENSFTTASAYTTQAVTSTKPATTTAKTSTVTTAKPATTAKTSTVTTAKPVTTPTETSITAVEDTVINTPTSTTSTIRTTTVTTQSEGTTDILQTVITTKTVPTIDKTSTTTISKTSPITTKNTITTVKNTLTETTATSTIRTTTVTTKITDTTTTTPTDFGYEYDGFLNSLKIKPYAFYLGEEIDMSNWTVSVYGIFDDGDCFINLEEKYSDGIPVTSEEYAHCFTVDTSEVDMNKEGYYHIYFSTIPGAKASFIDAWGSTYVLTMTEHTEIYRVDVIKRPEPYLSIVGNDNIYADDSHDFIIGGNETADLTGLKITAEPEGIVELGKLKGNFNSESSYYFSVLGLKAGTATIKATTDSGLTIEKQVNVFDNSMRFSSFKYSGYTGQNDWISFYCSDLKDIEFSIADENVAKIIEIKNSENWCEEPVWYDIKFIIVSEGNTQLIAESDDGKSAFFEIIGR